MKKVFVASSGDLYDERMKLKLLLHDIGVKPVLWETSEHSITREEFQSRLNKDLASSNIVIFMVKTKFGKYTKEEFDFACNKLGKGIEKIYVYFFEVSIYSLEEEQRNNIISFRDSIEDSKSIYRNVNDFIELENHIRQQREYWNLAEKEENKSITLLKNILEEKYISNIEPLKEAMLNYIPIHSHNYKEILHSYNFNNLLEVLLREIDNGYVHCILKALSIELEIFSKTKKCTKNRREIDKIILLVELDSNESVDFCNIDIWYLVGMDYKHYTSLKSIDVNEKDSDKNEIAKSLSNIKKEKKCSQSIEMQLILPNKLLESKYDFKNLKIRVQSNGFIPSSQESWSKYFDITTKFLLRYQFFLREEIESIRWWKEKSYSYRNSFSKEIKSFVYCCKGETIDPFNSSIHQGKEFFFSDKSLLDEENLNKILEVATPFIICPQKQEVNIESINLENKSAKDIKREAFLLFTKTAKTIHYIHDDAYDTEQLLLARDGRVKLENEQDDNNFLI